jgi:putative SOS response-associated peptidase YedK
MCGSYGFSVKNAKDVYERFDIYNELPDFKPRYNIKPGQQNPVITKHSPNYISRMVWGLIPSWAKYDSFRFNTINARVEGIESKSVYGNRSGRSAASCRQQGFMNRINSTMQSLRFPSIIFN